ncbi:hypothetical protein LTR96_011379 [Exophiala xenobiotica]|nr:hypothetical protein LTR41_011623 [Exophiala xenobiotica]KAK5215228.1 hypothetical protein LTR72_011697 [Exophiala xenobiotica]KAK5220958.1 hypothetical protein LTR47_010975 [Exophiala xenobiotica]KAK5243769.1 hypothetical protein LTS06_010530 [Exophiala xenobiotica]KAK5263208.1 hypothetical protein LTR96_011379 [Exophiala xenobiotica]
MQYLVALLATKSPWLLPPRPDSIQMFYNAWQPQPIRAVNYLPWDDTISELFDYRQAVQASISLLASFSLITRNTDTSVSLHPLAHAWCRGRTSEDEEGPLNYRRALTLLSTSVNWEFASEDYTFGGRWDLPADWSQEEKVEQWTSLALILAENGWTTDTLPLTEEVVALQKSKLGSDHPDKLESAKLLAHLAQEPEDLTLVDDTQKIPNRPRFKSPRWIRSSKRSEFQVNTDIESLCIGRQR